MFIRLQLMQATIYFSKENNLIFFLYIFVSEYFAVKCFKPFCANCIDKSTLSNSLRASKGVSLSVSLKLKRNLSGNVHDNYMLLHPRLIHISSTKYSYDQHRSIVNCSAGYISCGETIFSLLVLIPFLQNCLPLHTRWLTVKVVNFRISCFHINVLHRWSFYPDSVR